MAQDKEYKMNLSAEAVQNIKRVIGVGAGDEEGNTDVTITTNAIYSENPQEGEKDIDELIQYRKITFDGSEAAVNINMNTHRVLTRNGEYDDIVTKSGDTALGYVYEGNAKVSVEVPLEALISSTPGYSYAPSADHTTDQVTVTLDNADYADYLVPDTINTWEAFHITSEDAVSHYNLQLVNRYTDDFVTADATIGVAKVTGENDDYTITIPFELRKDDFDTSGAKVDREVKINNFIARMDAAGYNVTITKKSESV